MKVTKRQLAKIIQEETQRKNEIDSLSQSLREAYAEHLLLTYPNALLSEGYITPAMYTRACKMRMLNEAGGINRKLQEGFFDDVKKMAGKIGGKALDVGKDLGSKALSKGKEIAKKGGKAALKKAKEIGNKEIDTKKFAKDASRIGKEAGEMASGIGTGIWNALAPMAKKLGSSAASVAKDTVKATVENLPDVLSTFKKVVGDVASAGAGAIGDTASGLAGMIQKAQEGLSMEKIAKEDPTGFLASYQELQQKLNDMGVPAETPELAQSTLGIFETPEGQEALAAGSKKAGVTPAELKSLVGMYVAQSEYVDMATKAKAQLGEGTITRSQIRGLVRTAIKGKK